jgi:hypothetical protein
LIFPVVKWSPSCIESWRVSRKRNADRPSRELERPTVVVNAYGVVVSIKGIGEVDGPEAVAYLSMCVEIKDLRISGCDSQWEMSLWTPTGAEVTKDRGLVVEDGVEVSYGLASSLAEIGNENPVVERRFSLGDNEAGILKDYRLRRVPSDNEPHNARTSVNCTELVRPGIAPCRHFAARRMRDSGNGSGEDELR